MCKYRPFKDKPSIPGKYLRGTNNKKAIRHFVGMGDISGDDTLKDHQIFQEEIQEQKQKEE
eukprot:13222428-Ditylum_brightwellii.AAC.1